ncbi:MAG: tetratricopeptide repeat protein [Kofleriaceae bacterium]
MRFVALAIVLACATARADDAGTASGAAIASGDAEADAALRAAIARSATDAAGATADLEALGARRPLTRWSDNAWSEAARLSEAVGDYARARRALEQVIAIDMDRVMVTRARATIERLAANTGDGQWDAIAREHDRLVSAIFAGGDPHDDLAALEELVRANPAYPRAVVACVAIARGYEMEGDADIALAWMRRAGDSAGPDERGQRTRLELARMAIRAGELEVASRELADLRANVATDRAAWANAMSDLATAHSRRWVRRAAWGLLALLAFAAIARLARDLGTSETGTRFAWGAALRRIVRPPVEVVFMLPLAGLVVAIAVANNPLVARSIASISAAGIVIAWISGVLVDVARERERSRVRLALHLTCVVIAVAGVFFLAVERGVIQLLIETWRGGHAH